LSYAVSAVDPNFFGIAPIPAVKNALEKASLSINDIDLFEINEAFAAIAIVVQRELSIPEEKLNVNGGAVALGHPLERRVPCSSQKYFMSYEIAKPNLVVFLFVSVADKELL